MAAAGLGRVAGLGMVGGIGCDMVGAIAGRDDGPSMGAVGAIGLVGIVGGLGGVFCCKYAGRGIIGYGAAVGVVVGTATGIVGGIGDADRAGAVIPPWSVSDKGGKGDVASCRIIV